MTGLGADAGSATALLETRALEVVLDVDVGLVRAIDALDLAIESGQTFALVGESGCGKSMTALALMRLLPDNGRIAAGSIRLSGEELLALPESTMRRRRGGRLGMIFQDPSTSLNPVMRVGQQIIETIVAHSALRGAAARAKAIEWMTQVGIADPGERIDSFPFQLSGGQKQRVMIAIALAAEPRLLIADEPTTALDVTIQAQILELLIELQGRLGMAILLISHDLAVVSRMAHHVALMYAGQIVETAPAAAFFASPRHPYARQLLAARPERGQRDRPLSSIHGSVPPLTGRFDGCRFVERCLSVRPECAVTRPDLVDSGALHQVRCLLYSEGHAAPRSPIVDSDKRANFAARAAGHGATATALLTVRDLKVYFPVRRGVLRRVTDHIHAVDGISFSVARGETLALVGESGCGKTTTGKALLQLLRDRAWVQGVIDFNGVDLQRSRGNVLKQARRGAQIIFQDPFASLDPRMRVRDILEEGLLTLRPELDAPRRTSLLHALLERVGMRDDVLERYPHEFSGGQRQRVAIARALAVEPALIVCDEPTSALDVSVQAQILNLLKDLQRQSGVAYLFITHNIGVVEYLADRIAVMFQGKIVEQGPAAEVLGRPQHDYTRQLLAAVPRLLSSTATS